MRFGSVDLFMDFGEEGVRRGRSPANQAFLKALLTHGRFESYHFFCPDLNHRERFQERLERLVPDPQLRGRVQTSLQVALAESLREQDFAVFHQGDLASSMPYLIGLRNRLARVPFPITGMAHSLDGIFMNSRYLELLLAGLASYDGIVCPSPSAQRVVEKGLDWVGKHLRERTGVAFHTHVRFGVIPQGIDDSFFQDEDRKEARTFFHFPPDSLIALSVGRISLRHKADWAPALELIARMEERKEARNLVLIIAGGGQPADTALLEAMIDQMGLRKKVFLFPNFQPEVKRKLYQAADFYLSIVDNFQETFGLPLLEAMASGLPVVVSDFSGFRDFITEGREGFFLPTTWTDRLPEFIADNLGILDPSMARLYLSQMVSVDLEKLRSSILWLAGDANLRARMGAAAKARALAHRWSSIIPRYEDFWARLKEEARQYSINPLEPPAILLGDFSATFSHYPSRRLSPLDLIGLTDYGRVFLHSPASLIRYEDIQVCIFPDLENLLLDSLLQRSRSVSDLRELGEKALEASRGQVDFHLLWLLKHGVLKVESP